MMTLNENAWEIGIEFGLKLVIFRHLAMRYLKACTDKTPIEGRSFGWQQEDASQNNHSRVNDKTLPQMDDRANVVP